jgi:hypothetical protein
MVAPPGDHIEGPMFVLRTWQESVPGGEPREVWYARVVRVRPDTIDTDLRADREATSSCPATPMSTLDGAVSVAVERWQRIWGGERGRGGS